MQNSRNSHNGYVIASFLKLFLFLSFFQLTTLLVFEFNDGLHIIHNRGVEKACNSRVGYLKLLHNRQEGTQNLSDFSLGFDNPQFKSVCQKKWNLVWRISVSICTPLNHCAASKFGQNLSQEFLISLGYITLCIHSLEV